jgi:cobalt-zinc-cadmium efflux system protein
VAIVGSSPSTGSDRPPVAGPDHAPESRRGDHHHDGHDHLATSGTQRRALWIALLANASFLGAEVVGGVVFGSLALLADAAHMASDVVGLVIALIAQTLMYRPPTGRHSFGLRRAEVLGAQLNGILLVVVSGWVIYAAIRRLGQPADIEAVGLLVVATLGLAVNLASAFVLGRAAAGGGNLNLRGALIHMLADAAGSLGAIAAGIAVLVWDATWVDPVASIAIALLVLWSAWGLLRATTDVLLEGTPRGIDPVLVSQTLTADDAVEAVHHLHLWSLASDQPALSAHVVIRGEVALHQAQQDNDRLKEVLAVRFGIHHATLELECHSCEQPDQSGADSG